MTTVLIAKNSEASATGRRNRGVNRRERLDRRDAAYDRGERAYDRHPDLNGREEALGLVLHPRHYLRRLKAVFGELVYYAPARRYDGDFGHGEESVKHYEKEYYKRLYKQAFS